jgi:crotonobetainyl-CoA:carnitine CoA-transferase CaiB-like acyl-CoA transferase
MIAGGNDAQYVRLCQLLGAQELADEPKYKNNAGRLQHRDELIAKLSALTSRLPREELLAKLDAAGLPAGPINDLQQVFANPQVMARGMRIERPNAAAKAGKVPGVRTPITIDGWGAAAGHGAPDLGQHTAEILKEIGES